MGMLDGFNADEVDTSGLPDGQYQAEIITVAEKQTKSGGGMVCLTWRISDGAQKNRQIFQNLNMVNSNPTAVAMARADLARICKACDVPAPGPGGEKIKFKRCLVTVSTKTKDGYTNTEIKKVEKFGGTMAATVAAFVPPAVTTPAGPKPAPWKKPEPSGATVTAPAAPSATAEQGDGFNPPS